MAVSHPNFKGVLERLPPIAGEPVEIRIVNGLADRHGPVHGGCFLRTRRIHLRAALLRDPVEFQRILVHELFHFVWVRLGNPLRRSYEDLLAAELRAGVPGELGWSAEWRKRSLAPRDWLARTRRWREYVCESFCDSAGWRFSGVARHSEFTLSTAQRRARAAWFRDSGVERRISI